MTAATLTLTDFLLARIAEDEEVARAATSLVPWVHIANAAAAHDQREAGLFVLDWRPSRVLAECEAKRQIVGIHKPDVDPEWARERTYVTLECAACGSGYEGEYAGMGDFDPVPWPCPTLRALAVVYADHPDYREEWKP